jgi:hypothetical protein
MTNNPNIQTVQMKDVLAELSAYFKAFKSFLPKAFLMGLLLSALAMGYYFWQKPSYSAEASFILEEKSAAGGGLAGIASQFGFDIGTLSGNNGIFAGDNILDIIGSRNIIEKVLLTPVQSTDASKKERLIDLFISAEKLKTKKWNRIAGIDTINFTNYNTGDRIKDSLLYVVYKQIVKKNLIVERLNKKGTIIKVIVTSRHEVFSKLFTDRLVSNTISFYVGIKTSVAAQNMMRLERRSDSLLALLNAKSYQTATQQILDANVAYKSATVPSELTQREKTLTYALYTEVTKNLEASRMSLASQTPIINLLDVPKYPLEDASTPWFLLLAGVWVFAIAISFLWAFFVYKSPR